MLRNWSERIPAGSPAAGALVGGTPYVGLLGSQILADTAEGTHGFGLIFGWLPNAADRYRVLYTNVTGGPVRADEDGAGESDSPFTATVLAYQNNLLVDTVAFNGLIGDPLQGNSSATLSLSGAAAAAVIAAASSSAALALSGTGAASAVAGADSAVTLGLSGAAQAMVGSVRGSVARISMSARSLRVTPVS